MEPVKHSSHNFVYRGPTPDIGDLSCRVYPTPGQQRIVYSNWKPSDHELQVLLAGGTIELGIHTPEAIPPVSIGVAEHE